MHCMGRNTQTVYYAQYLSKTEITDSNGNATGEYTETYGTPVEARMNISASVGDSVLRAFGLNQKNYTRTMVTHDMDCPINEKTQIWYGCEPSSSVPHNYEVVSVSKSLNSITYGLQEVNAT